MGKVGVWTFTAANKYKAVPDGLLIRRLGRDDAGSYKCKATQMHEQITDFKDLLIELKVQRELILS